MRVAGLRGPASQGFERCVGCQLAMVRGTREALRSRSMKRREMTRHSGENCAMLWMERRRRKIASSDGTLPPSAATCTGLGLGLGLGLG